MGENLNDLFQKLLIERGLRDSALYSLQQNGKYERFWHTIEMVPNEDDVLRLIEEYNGTPHFSVPQIQRTRGIGWTTPREIWFDSSHQ
jgi:hypothetical protein